MKKIPIFVLSILFLGLLFGPSQPSHAAIFENDTTWWTVEELLEFYPEVEAEKDAECGDNQDCQMEFNFSMIERGPKYSALSNLLEGQFWITSINPTTGTIKVLFFDDDMMLKRMGIEEKLTIENLYIGWTETWLGHGYYHNFVTPFDDTMLGVHQLFNSETEDTGLVVPWQENEFPMLEPDISGNTSGVLYYTIYAEDEMFNAQGTFNYSSCLNTPEYQEGTECKMYVSGDQWVSYFPPRDATVENNPSEGFGEIDADEPTTIEITGISGNTNIKQQEETKGTIDLQELQSLQKSGIKTVPKAPHTGEYDAISNSYKAINFPWWLTILIVLGGATLLWFFWPKKSKKSLDKNKRVR